VRSARIATEAVMKSRKRISTLSAALGIALASTGASAQSQAPEPAQMPTVLAQAPQELADASAPASAAAADVSPALEAVVITAERRTEDVKDVPISVSVMGAEELQDQRIGNIDDLSRAVPGVAFNSWGGTDGLTNIVIRGVSSTSGAATVGLYLDDVSITTKNLFDPGSAQPKLYDLERIEVLRGPQGTLFGDSSEGGTLRYITQAPDLKEFSGDLTGDLSQTKHGGTNYLSAAVINVPVQEGVFAVRGTVGFVHDSGYIDHYSLAGVLDDHGVNTDGVTTVHLVGKLALGGSLTITPSIFFQRDVTGDNAAFYPSRGSTTVTANNVLSPSLGLWQQDKQVREFGNDMMLLPSLTVSKTLDFADVTSVTGLYVRKFDRQEDGTFYNSATFAAAFLDPLYPAYQAQNDATIGTLRSPVEFSTHYRQVSQEFRLSSLPEDRARTKMQWVAGVYYADQWIHNTNFQQIPGIDQAFQSIYGYSINSPAQSLVYQTYSLPGITELFPNSIDESDDRTYREQQYALFGQIDYDLTPRLHAGFGARYATSRENYDSVEIGFYQIGNISPYYQTASYQAFTPKATLTFDVGPESTIYASVGKGFRLGGPTGPIVFGPTSVCAGDFANIGQTTQPTQFGSDSLWTYEFGTKNRVPSAGFMLDAAAFVTQWSNIQQQIYLPTCGYYFTANIGDAKIYGAEIEASYRPTPNLKFGVSASAEHAVVTNTFNPLSVAVGAHLIDVPQGTYTASASYSHPVGGDYTVSTRADYSWTGHSYGSYQVSNPDYYNPSYGVLNASVSVTASKYEVSLYAKNLNGDQKIIQTPEINTVVEGFTVRPRTVGVTARYWF
jgi:iron complex outermembrane recepter protein